MHSGNILVVCGDKGVAPGGSKGASIHQRSVIRAFASSGFNCVLHTRRGPEALHGIPADIRTGTALSDLKATIREVKPVMVYERYSLDHMAGLGAARESGIPFVLEVNAPLFEEASEHRPDTVGDKSEANEATLFRDSDFVFPVSTFLADYVSRLRGTREGVTVVPNGIDPDLFQVPWQRRQAAECARIGFLGQPKPWHGLNMLSGMLRTFRAQNREIELLIIGGGKYAERFIDDLKAESLDEMVAVTGPLTQEDSIDRLRGCDMSVAPYGDRHDFYFCPLKVVESLALGIPLVTSAIGDIPRLAAGKACLTEPGDVEGFCRAIAAIAESPSGAIDLADAARSEVLARNTWENHVQSIVNRVLSSPEHEVHE